MAVRSPSGEDITIRHGDYEAVVVEVGAGLRTLKRRGDDVVAGYAEDEMCSAGRGQQLLPWPNRIRDGRYEFDRSTYQLPLTEVARHNAIHGLTRWANWVLLDRSDSLARGGLRLRPQPGYPFSLEIEVEYSLSDDGLRVEVVTANVGTSPAPYGHGAHPYLTVGRRIDDCELTLPAGARCETDERGLPGEAEDVAGGPYDFRSPRLIGGTTFDHPFTRLEADPDGLTRVTLRDPDTGRSASLWAESAYPWLQVFSGDGLGARAREALAVEPMTCPPDAFNSGVDLIVLQPGESHASVFGIA